MAIQTINVGSAPNDGTGDSLRTAFVTINNNFSYLGNVNSNLSANSLYVAGDITAIGNLYVGPGANVLTVVNPIFVGTDSGSGYVQTVIKNTQGNGSADITAFSNIGSDTGGWVSTGITGNTFNDTAYTITGNVDGYLFHQGYSGYGGNLVLATGGQGTTNDLVIAVGGFTSNKEVMRFSNSAQALQVKTTTISTSTTTGALVVSGGVGVAGNINAGNITAGNVTATNLVGTLATAAQTNITSVGTLAANLTLTSGLWLQSDSPGGLGSNININDANKIIRSVGSYFRTNISVTETIVLDSGNTALQTTGVGVNANVTLSYSSTITPGYIRYSAIQNLSGATRQIVLPNSNNNKGTNTIIIANGITASFTYTAFDTTAANVVVFIANN